MTIAIATLVFLVLLVVLFGFARTRIARAAQQLSPDKLNERMSALEKSRGLAPSGVDFAALQAETMRRLAAEKQHEQRPEP